MRDDLRELLDALDMETYLDSQGITYKVTRGSSGLQLNVKECPTCGNGKWKVYLNAESGVGNCFAGDHPPGEYFSKWSFVKAVLGSPINRVVIDHLRQYALEAGWRPARRTSVAVEEKTDWELPTSHPIPVQGKNLAYLENRGIDRELAAYFHMRICTRGWFKYRGLDGNWAFQDYSMRVLLPIHDLDGALVTFQGRDILGTQEPKYLFPPALPGSGRYLYNGLNVMDTKRVVMGEGAFDVAALKIAMDADPALRDVVPIGTFGKHLSDGPDSQMSRLKQLKDRGLEELTIMWDGEIQATDDAIEAGHRIRNQLGLRVRIGMLPQDKDPNEVPAQVVRDTFYKATLLDSAIAGMRLQMLRRKLAA